MVNCWADKLGDCSGKQSKEHLVSKALFKEDKRYEPGVVVPYGLPGFEDKPRKVSIDSIASKILCDHHNNLLSHTDSEGAYAFDVFRRVWEAVFDRKVARDDENITYEINGSLMERWFIKTAINLIYTGYNIKKPPKCLVELAFGLKRFPKNVGLCVAFSPGHHKSKSEDDLKIVPIIKNDETIDFVLFEFRGMKFALPLIATPLPESVNFINHESYSYPPVDDFVKEFLKARLKYHIKGVNFNFGDDNKFSIKFNWEQLNPSEVPVYKDLEGWRLDKDRMFYTLPVAVDADGNQAFCVSRFNEKEGKFELQIPQDFLERAKYPVKVRWGFYPRRKSAIESYERIVKEKK